MNLNCLSEAGIFSSAPTLVKDVRLCESEQQGSRTEYVEERAPCGNVIDAIQLLDVCNFVDVQTANGGTETTVDSMASSPCLTDALRAEATTQTSSLVSVTPAHPSYTIAPATTWDGGEKSYTLPPDDNVSNFTIGAFFSASLRNKLDDKTSDSCLASNSLKTEVASGVSPCDATDHFSLMHGQPYTEDAGIWGFQGRGTDAMENMMESAGMDKTTPILSLQLPDSAKDATDRKGNFEKNLDTTINADKKSEEEVTITVLDPQRSKLHVPLSAIIPTKALGDRLRHPSLCLLFQSGRCRQATNCYQMHVDPEVVQRIRQIVENLPSCCAFHGDCNVKLWDADAHANRSVIIGDISVPLNRVAYTNGLVRFVINDAQRPLNFGTLCRLHGKPGGCRYGADCWYVHVCRDIVKERASAMGLDPLGSLNNSQIEGLPLKNTKEASMMGAFHKGVSTGQHRQHQMAPSDCRCLPTTTNSNHRKNDKITSKSQFDNTILSDAYPKKVFCASSKKKPLQQFFPMNTYGNRVLNQNGSAGAEMRPPPAMQILMPSHGCADGDSAMSINMRALASGSTFTPMGTTDRSSNAPFCFVKQEQALNIASIGLDSLSGACPGVWLPQKLSQGGQMCQPLPNWNLGVPRTLITPPAGTVYPTYSATGLPLATRQHPIRHDLNSLNVLGLVTEVGGNEGNISLLRCEMTKGGVLPQSALTFLFNGHSQTPSH